MGCGTWVSDHQRLAFIFYSIALFRPTFEIEEAGGLSYGVKLGFKRLAPPKTKERGE